MNRGLLAFTASVATTISACAQFETPDRARLTADDNPAEVALFPRDALPQTVVRYARRELNGSLQPIVGGIPLPSKGIVHLGGTLGFESHPMSHWRFEDEPVDQLWAPQMEKTLRDIVDPIGDVAEVQCRTNVCRAVLATHYLDFANDDTVLIENYRNIRVLLWESLFPVLQTSYGRLLGFGIATSGLDSSEEPSQVVVYLIGPLVSLDQSG